MIALAAFAAVTAPALGDPFAPFELRTLARAPYRWRPGRTTVLSFCAFWCDTWKDQLPRVRESMRATQGLPVEFATVSVDGRWTERANAASVGTMLGDPGGTWSHGIGIDRVPYTLVVDPQGHIAWVAYGTVRTADLTNAVRRAIAQKTETGGTIYLTFDDFPADRLSDELLDALRAENVKATFFCVGSRALPMRGLLKRAVREGHGLGVHSWAHDGNRPEVARCAAAIREACGADAPLYRPPGSEKVFKDGRALSLPVDDPYDYTRPGPDELVRRVLAGAKPNAVVQLHAGVEDTVRALPRIVKTLRARGYSFAVLRNE